MLYFTADSFYNAIRNGGSGAYIRRSDGTTSSLSIPAGNLSSNNRAEVHVLKAATELLIEEDCNQQNIVLLSDSLSVLQSLTNGPTDHHTQQLHNSLCTLSNNNRVVLQWVPAHVGIAGNKTADRLAKAAAKLPQLHLFTSYKEVKILLKQEQKSAWRLKNNGYDPQKDQINRLINNGYDPQKDQINRLINKGYDPQKDQINRLINNGYDPQKDQINRLINNGYDPQKDQINRLINNGYDPQKDQINRLINKGYDPQKDQINRLINNGYDPQKDQINRLINNGYDPQKDQTNTLTGGPKPPSSVCVLVTVG